MYFKHDQCSRSALRGSHLSQVPPVAASSQGGLCNSLPGFAERVHSVSQSHCRFFTCNFWVPKGWFATLLTAFATSCVLPDAVACRWLLSLITNSPKLCCNPLVPPQPYTGSVRPDFHISVRESFGDKSIFRKHYAGKESSSEPQTEALHSVKWQPTICINCYFVVKNWYWMSVSADWETDKPQHSIMHVVFWTRNYCFQAFSQFSVFRFHLPVISISVPLHTQVSWLLAFPLLPRIITQASKPPF